GELRNPVRPHEAAHLDARKACRRQGRDEPHLVVDREPRRFVLQPVAGADFVERHARRIHGQLRALTFARTHSAIDRVGAPGWKTSSPPIPWEGPMSESGMIPPPKTTTSWAPWFFKSSMTAGNSVMCAPDMIERPTASTSS